MTLLPHRSVLFSGEIHLEGIVHRFVVNFLKLVTEILARRKFKQWNQLLGWGTVMWSRRSRATKEFIDAKFSCIRYGNKQQSDDAINPRPSPKIGCKASMHVKRRSSSGKWYIHSFIREHNHELLPAQVHFFRSHRNVDPLNNDAKVRRKNMLASVSKQYGSYQFSEEAKANFDAWHEMPELKSPSPFEKQMLLLYTHEIFKKFQVEVLGASACHLKKESEDGTAITYAVKDFEANQDFVVEWDAPKSELYCSCHLFEYKGYLCRHAIVVLQMSGVFVIPSKYILQRWTNAATSKHSISEGLDDAQAKVRRYNDLCRRAIILGEEGSLTQESYNIAIGAITEALKKCQGNTLAANRKSGSSATPAIQVDEVCQGNTLAARELEPDSEAAQTSKGSKRADPGNERESNRNISNKKGKAPLEPEIANSAQEDFHQMDMPSSLYHPARFLTTLLRGGDINRRGAELLGEMLQEQN
ncbi:hypothetical protein KY290_019290 [Solanum tuberosum]|uniref:Protein FAR1-RELATED SEQUENCE n=1 Tax=Solanum tuberosum TaxID=4113 RepID=A0ABQ7VGL8_SOLTU|nr:hypothetical protein KY284_018980 [Solanum tuberosum]KAH0763217.1 hypothetical protein KY290_019290 [Solanum tuberosum]